MQNSSNQSLEAEPLPLIAPNLTSSLRPARWTINPGSSFQIGAVFRGLRIILAPRVIQLTCG